MLLSGLRRTEHHIYDISDRDIVRTAFFGIELLGQIALKRHIISVIKNIEPEIILLLHADYVGRDILAEIKALSPQAKIVWVDCDALTHHAIQRLNKRVISKLPSLDMAFFTTAGATLEKLNLPNLPARFIPYPLDGAIITPRPIDEVDVDVAFASTIKERFAVVDKIKAIVPSLTSVDIGRDGVTHYGRPFLAQLGRAKFGLNISVHEKDFYSSDRIATLFGLGLCVCLHKDTGFQKFFEGDEAIFYSSTEDLAHKISMHQSHNKWIEVGHKGREKYLKLFDARRVAEYLIDAIVGSNIEDYGWDYL